MEKYDKRKVQCYYFKKFGHFAADYWSNRERKSEEANEDRRDLMMNLCYLCLLNQMSCIWQIDGIWTLVAQIILMEIRNGWLILTLKRG